MLVVSALVFAGLYYFANVPSFWYDELYTVGSIRSELTFKDTFNIYAHEDINSPLYFFIAFFWYRIVPHTERALISLSILFVIAASIITGLSAKKIGGIKMGIFAFLFMISDKWAMMNASNEFRSYSLLIFVSALNAYFYLRRLEDESWLNIILYGVTMCLLPYTHYVAVLICFGLFIVDCVFIFKGRAGFKVIISYLIGALLFSPWLLAALLPRISKFKGSGGYIASLSGVIKILRLHSGKNPQSFAFFAAFIGLIYLLKHIYNNKHDLATRYLSAGIFASAFMLMSSYIYCAFINPKGSFFVHRYFFPIMPSACMIMAYGADYVYNKLKPSFNKSVVLLFTFIFAVLLVDNLANLSRQNEPGEGVHQPYREVANIIYKSEQNYQGRSIILTTDGPTFFEGWKELYLSADHTRNCPEALLMTSSITDSEIIDKLQSGNYDRIYLSWLHAGINHPDVMEWLHSNYDFGDRPGDNKSGDYRFQILERRK